MTLQVRKVLHVERSLYQDVLVFESETYGNVLVLDGVIQCTERDEFSYQEMIAHLPLASHPNPQKVLVIGGGDGGVVREVLKHQGVKNVVLCDIDEAVVRVSRQFLPHMSALLDDPRVTVFIGDGFKFLADNTSTYDVIVTDSSDPVGPAQSLFQKPYFELLHAALAPGGHIATQAECLWLHLPLIKGTGCDRRKDLPCDRVRVHDDPHLSLRTDRVPRVFKGRRPQPPRACAASGTYEVLQRQGAPCIVCAP